MNTLELQKFCGTDALRDYLNQPFSRGPYTYATNGHIMLRMPRDERYAETTKDWNFDAPMKGIERANFSPPTVALPPEPADRAVECKKCNGRGFLHDCPDCECECPKCDGKGIADPESLVSATFDGRVYQLRYLRMMLSLPGVMLAASPTDERPLLFKFDGGEGALMSMRGPYDEHIELAPLVSKDGNSAHSRTDTGG